MMKRRVLSILITLCMVLTAFPLNAFAIGNATDGNGNDVMISPGRLPSTADNTGNLDFPDDATYPIQPAPVQVADDVTVTALDGTASGNPAENYPNLVDGKKEDLDFTKWCFNFNSGAYVVLKASANASVLSYTLTTGNDNAANKGRNPKSWTLYGCNDYDEATKSGGSWVSLHSVTDDEVMQDVNFTDYKYTVSDAAKYRYYKFVFTANKGSGLIQLCEIGFEFAKCSHNWEQISATDATCSKDATVTRHCTVCDMTKREATSERLGHNLGEDNCCTRCGERVINEVGDFVIYNKYGDSSAYSFSNGTLKILSSDELKISNKNKTTPTRNTIFIQKDVQANLIFDGVNIDASGCAFKMSDGTTKDVNITLADGSVNTFKSKNPYSAIEKNATIGWLNIKCEHCSDDGHGCNGNCGKLIAYGGDNAAGIGGGYGQDGDNIAIYGGVVVTTPGASGAGIGGGNGGKCENVILYGGIITANGKSNTYAVGGKSTSNIAIGNASVKTIGAGFGTAPVGVSEESPKKVRALTIANPNSEYVSIDGKVYPSNHSPADSSDTSLYAYLTEDTHTVQVGTNVYTYTYSSSKNTFELSNTTSLATEWAFNITATNSGDIAKYKIDYEYEDDTLTIISDKAMTISNKNKSEATNDKIVIKKDVQANLTLNGVNINSDKRAFTMMSETTKEVNLILANGSVNTFKSTNPYAGIEKNASKAFLNIKCEGCSSSSHICNADCGKLIAIGGENAAGIGGGYGQDGDNIAIYGGTVVANGGASGAGIGGGKDGKCSNIKILGGTVTATAGNSSACAIGNGTLGDGTSNVVIAGGSVKVNGDIGTTPTNGDAKNPKNVYLLKIDNPNNAAVEIDGKAYSPVNHKSADSDDSSLYAYLSGERHIVKIGSQTYYYNYDKDLFGRVYSVKYITDGGTQIADNLTTKYSDKVLDGIEAPTREGYEFVRWECGGKTVTADTLYSDLVANENVNDITLTAKWICLATDSDEFKNAVTDANILGVKMMSDIKVSGSVLMVGKFSLDLNGYVLDCEIKMYDNTLTLTDSRPTARHTDSSLPDGGAWKGEIEMTRPEKGYPETIIIGNGGTVLANVYMNTFASKVTSDSSTKTVFTGYVGKYGTIADGIFKGRTNGTIEGGLFYIETEGTVKNIRVDFDGTSVFAVTENGKGISEPDVVPKKTGYTCVDKWYTDTELTEKWSFASDTVTENITLYGEFTPNKYTVRFYTGDENSMYFTQAFIYDQPKELAKMFFNKDNFVFVGWCTTADGKGTMYNDCEEVSSLTAEPNGIVRLYPIWKPEYTTLSGTVKTYGSDKDTVTVKVLKAMNDGMQVMYETTVVGNTVEYSIENVLTTENYMVEITKNSHATIRKSLFISSANPTLDCEINLYGDVNLDGVIDVFDIVEAERVVNSHKTFDGYSLSTADTNSDGVVDANDYTYIVNKALEA